MVLTRVPILALVCVACFSATAKAQGREYLATYDANTGEIWFGFPNPVPCGTVGITLRSDSGALAAENMNQDFGQLNDDSLAPDALGWSNFGGLRYSQSSPASIF